MMNTYLQFSIYNLPFRISLIIIVCVLIGLGACGNSHEYHKIVEKELATGVRYDSVFLGFYLGMPKKDFYDRCWKLNKQGLMRQGAENMSVSFEMDIVGNKSTIDFYPTFHKDIAYEMVVMYRHNAWAPWNKDLWAEPLMYRILAIYEKTYGEGFIEIKHSKLGSAFVKVDGNRRISIYQKDDQRVRAVFTDLLVEEEAEKNIPKVAEKVANQPLWFE